jgi:hypothetical protein
LIPLYWVQKQQQLSTAAGMHRFVWDLHHAAPSSTRHDYPISAVPHDTPRLPLGPTVVPGNYIVRLTVDGKSSTAPLTVKMDPRVKTTVADLEKKFQTEKQLASIMTESAQALIQAGSIRAQVEKLSAAANSSTNPATKDAIEAFEKKLTALLGAPGGFFAPPSTDVTLGRVNGEAGTLYGQLWPVDAAPTSSQLEALSATEHESSDVLKRWSEFKSADLPALNRMLRESKVPEVQLDANLHSEEPQVDEE